MKQSVGSGRFMCSWRRRLGSVVILGMLFGMMTVQRADGWSNILKDPGFEQYRLDRRGFYRPTVDAEWAEIAMGRGSVQLDMNDWDAPVQMVGERTLGFTPGTTGYEGEGPHQNSGRIILQQDVVAADLLSANDQLYEAWIWLGGAGRDNDNNADCSDEAGGWEVFFYGSDDPSEWTEDEVLERHHMRKDFWGKPGTFVQVAGFGRIPAGTKGIRMRVWASTWGQASTPAQRDGFKTEVALDNAHFAVIGASNMLINAAVDDFFLAPTSKPKPD
ncbi:MAG: hypothetical protein J7M40_10580 [Planctomycetes bacterium]|nr:hypothetical protein [Planctomycetota bacterium]